MFHQLAWFEALGTVANTDIQPVVDDIFLIQNNHFIPQGPLGLYYALAGSATLSRVRFTSPKLRQITTPYLRPIQVAVLPASNPNIANYLDNPLKFAALEEITLEATSAIAMGTENFYCVAAVGNGVEPVPSGDIYTLRGTSTTAAVASSWTTIATTWQDNLPQGEYAVTNLEVQSANAIAARLIFQGQLFRPGSISVGALANRQNIELHSRQMGVYGRFTQTAMPLVQVLANAADAVHEIYLDIVRTR